MSGPYRRTDRLADQIKREVAIALSRDVKDPRLQFVTVTHVRLSRDLRTARVCYTTMATGEELEAIQTGLHRATGFVQKKVAERVVMRYTPQLTFAHDTSYERGTRMEKLLNDIERQLSDSGNDGESV